MNVRHSLVNLIALLALAGCSQAPTPGATPAATKSPTLKAQDTVTVTQGTNDVIAAGDFITKVPGQTGQPSVYLVAKTGGGDPNPGCNANGQANKATFTLTSDKPSTIPNPTGTYQTVGCGPSASVVIPYTVAANAVPGTIVELTINAATPQGTNTAATFKVKVIAPAPSDNTPPSITEQISGTPGLGGWYVSPVTVQWNVSDSESAISTTECASTTVSDDGSTTVTCTATSAGGPASKTVTIKKDATAPTVTPDNVTTGVWRNTPLSQEFTASDATSGLLADQPGVLDGKFTLTASADSVVGAPTVVTGSVKDNAGNSTTRSVSALIDTHKPTITAATFDVNGNALTATADGWFRQPVVVKFTCVDPQLNGADQSGVAGACPADVTVNETGSAGETVARTISDVAGNASDPVSLTVKVDTTAPTITATADHSGWFNGNVTVNFTCTENGSGLVGGCPAPVVVSAEGTTPVSASVTDRAGNSATSNVVNVQIDKTAPVASVQATTAPVNGWYRTDVAFAVTGTDAGGSGVASCTTPATLTTDATGYRAQGTCTDHAGNVSEVAQSVPVNRDTVAPTLTVTPDGTPSAFGWYRTDVTFTVAGNDERSGVSSCTQPATLSTEQAGYQAKATCTDNAGNTSAEVSSVAVNLDKTAPTFTRVVTPGPNADGWNNTDVTLDYTCADTLSGLDGACPADSTLTASADVAALTVADQAGNTASLAALSVKIDKVKPTITAVPDRAANSAGWYAAPVTVSFACTDDLSGVKTCTAPSTVGQTDADGQTVTGTASDKAGNTETTSLTVKVDATAPTISAATFDVNGNPISANANGWFKQTVIVKFTCADALSGVSTCPAPVTVGETALGGQTVTGSASDQAGNSASTGLNVKVDLTAPTATITPTPATPNGLNGWYTTQSVTFATSGTDNLTAVTCTPIPAITASTPGTTVQTTCTDLAGNTATASLPVKFDRDAPTLTLPGAITATATGNSQASVPFTVSASDNFTTPQPVTCRVGTTPVTSPAVFPVGTTTVTCAATDNAGNTSTGFFTVSVKYDFSGFFQPVDMNGLNTAKAGSAIPVKFSLGGNQGLNVMAAGYPKVYAISCSTLANLMPDEIETTVTAGGSSLTYDATAGQYVYVWKTSTSWAGTCQRLVVQLVDGTQKEAVFKFR
ncbi:PxKF domain-containing protein [Deinococcus sp. JMULE3]|uniref:PxKF domain-containing protein n=1 Tax=Deinococcus sp. JMULE3 TaxID=2518341 RepID=UPI001575A0DF|nr:PxKF domain-containing protein [Deinococcus sp. JMULE3]NTY01410.1 HYR domain-containing protein [Deinococcus sp. JMULE3]